MSSRCETCNYRKKSAYQLTTCPETIKGKPCETYVREVILEERQGFTAEKQREGQAFKEGKIPNTRFVPHL